MGSSMDMGMDTGSNRRIARNTLYLYFRMLLTMVVSLYTSRIVLAVLGVSDYGLYNVVGGMVSMLSMFGGTLAGGTQRFITYAIGEGDLMKLKKIFSISLRLNAGASLFLFILAETIGLWFLYTQMNIPDGRMNAAFWVYQFSVAAFIVGVLQIPFMSCLIAHEKMDMYAYMSIYDVVMKLLIVFLIQWLTFDKLILYAFLLLIVNITSILIYNVYCRNHFEECTFKMQWDKDLAKEIVAFGCWDIFGGSAGLLSGQGINILLNIFFGTVVNAARGISNTVNACIIGFISNFQTAVNPQIVKLYAAKEYDKLYKLVVNNARIAEYLFLFIAIPTFLEVDFFLTLWLGEYPNYTAIFVRIILIQSALQVVNRPMVMMIHATGHMKWPNLTAGISLMTMFPLSYLALKLGGAPVMVYWICAAIWSLDNIWVIYWPHHYVGIPVKRVLKEIYTNILIGAAVMFAIPWYVSTLMNEGWMRFFTVCGTSVAVSFIVIYFWGMTRGMRTMVLERLHLNK